ncbi:D-alanine-D-alanine ligase [Labedella gwakjiensis]|uniref:D-alanine--D-alanine ligase n=1 Tax=Labedella gwakjiensis TaxID=390269 RepID=A0A2P8GUN8_9MICO|nr:D-alanine--D-alanine ligase [Labedella gwakjiensis]PSL37687.1 D-alanine-D-alanine ligase [Labedella gwakjiensis]RUQ87719.1 D-alanine--D-alanine ligase [Labedella gwakjiensis]
MTRPTVAVIAGGRNSEHDVSLASAAGIRRALADDYDVLDVRIGRDGSWTIGDRRRVSASVAVAEVLRADVAFPALHGVNGEDGAIAGFLEIIGLPYVGSGVVASAIAMDKRATKLVAQSVGVRVARDVPVSEVRGRGTLPVIVKPVTGGSSHGVSLARTLPEFERALAATGADVMIEEVVVGREIDVAVLEEADGSLSVAPALEIPREPGSVFDVDAKYGGDPGFLVPAPLSALELETISAAAMAIFRALGCRGLARVDFFLDDRGLVFNEVNTMPGMTEHSQVPAMVRAAGMSYADLIRSLIEVARHRPSR